MNGPTQTALLAKAGPEGIVIPGNQAERCAAWRLARRGVLRRFRLGSPATGYLTVFRVVQK